MKKYFAILLLATGMAACTQGPGTKEAPDKVTVAGGETPTEGGPTEDVCEKEENLNNILCKWVATEIQIQYPNYTAIQKYGYDSEGRIERMTGTDQNGAKHGVGTLVYNDKGVQVIQYFSEPNPPGTEQWTSEWKINFEYYDQPGRVKSKIVEIKKNGVKQSSYQSGYTPLQGNIVDSVTAMYGPSSTPVGIAYERATYDPVTLKVQSTDKKNYGANLSSPTSWEQFTFQYDTGTGRLDKLITKTQDCTVNPCNNFQGPFNPSHISDLDFHFDDKGRETGYTWEDIHGGTEEGSCEMSYDFETKAKIVNIHPLEFMINTFAPIVITLGVNDQDIFSSWVCSRGGQVENDARFKWARLWEVLPGGRPPGS